MSASAGIGGLPLAKAILRCTSILASIVLLASPATARITKTRPQPSSSWVPGADVLQRFTIGSGFEIEPDVDETGYDFPGLIQYNFTEYLQLSLEPDIVYIESKDPRNPSVAGFSDLDTTLDWEFLHERRWRPALTAEGGIKFPTSTDRDIGSPGYDYAIGLIASKDLIYADLDLNAVYTFIGDNTVQDTVELSLSAEWPVTYYLDVLTEVSTTLATGAIRASNGAPTGLGNGDEFQETEGLLGLAVHVNKFLKLEGGVIRKSDQNWQFVFAWEYAFSGD